MILSEDRKCDSRNLKIVNQHNDNVWDELQTSQITCTQDATVSRSLGTFRPTFLVKIHEIVQNTHRHTQTHTQTHKHRHKHTHTHKHRRNGNGCYRKCHFPDMWAEWKGWKRYVFMLYSSQSVLEYNKILLYYFSCILLECIWIKS